ncbi:MAG TPA: UDP-N-acetylglucosamine 2-epimerase, partial [Candidatus Gracilibacteria bacterium]
MHDIYYASGSLESFVSQVGVDDRPAHFMMVGTKPDLIKQAPILKELQKRGEKSFLVHTGQHYDENLSKGIEKEFGLVVDANLGVSGGILSTNIARIIERFGELLHAIKEAHPKVQIIPYVHGDTTTCFATTTASFNLGFPVIHNEAGIRTFMIQKEVLDKFRHYEGSDFDFKRWFDLSSQRENYSKGSHEPFPEQWNTRGSEAGSGLFMAPVALAKENLENEGFPENRIFNVGNSVVDAMNFAGTINSDIFKKYPKLKKGFIRVCVHRRENTESEVRFTAIFEMIEQLSIETDQTILWILLPGTLKAIKNFGFDERLKLLKKKEHVLISDVWPKYSDVMAAM